jgi:hypothetical protein
MMEKGQHGLRSVKIEQELEKKNLTSLKIETGLSQK